MADRRPSSNQRLREVRGIASSGASTRCSPPTPELRRAARGKSPLALPLSVSSKVGQCYFGEIPAKWVNIQPALTLK